jgi:hypothetical protein
MNPINEQEYEDFLIDKDNYRYALRQATLRLLEEIEHLSYAEAEFQVKQAIEREELGD